MISIENYLNTQRTVKIIHLRLQTIQDTQMYLQKEEEQLLELSHQLQEKINEINTQLKQLTGIEYKLYYEIVVNGLKVTKAVDKVAFASDLDVSTIWKNYYHKIKNKIKELSH